MKTSLKRRIRIFIVAIVLLTTAIGAPLSTFADNSDPELAGASYAAKIYYYALYSCAKTKVNYDATGYGADAGALSIVWEALRKLISGGGAEGALESIQSNLSFGVETKKVNSGDVFFTGDDDYGIGSYLTNLGVVSLAIEGVQQAIARISSNTNVGIIIGVKEGGQEDGAMLCGRGKNAMMKSAIKYFDKLSQKRGKGGVTMKDIACDYSDPTKPGIFAGDNDGKSGNCGAIFDRNSEDTHLYVADNRLDYLDKFAKGKLGYTQDELLNFTDTELYYIYFWTFDLYCATPNEGGDYPNVNAITTKDADGAPIPATFGKKNYQSISDSRKTKTIKLHLTAEADNNKVKVKDKAVTKLKNGETATCDNIYKILSDDDNEIVKAFSEYVENNGGEIEDPGEPVTSNTDWCSSINNALAWLVCPMIEMLRDTATEMYKNMIEPLLSVESTLVGRGQKSVYDAWSTFRIAANTLLIIALLVIIFSQITGIGIDNYGIKKTLPKLIVAAILINLSYIICQIAVDLSNLLGYGLNAVFDKLSEGLVVTGFTSTGQKAGGVATGVAIVGGTVAAVAGAAYLAPELLVAAIPGILGTLIAAIVAIFFFFFLLGARKAGIILLVALSPLAFVCYMLPNTKNLFQKWKKMFIGLLIMYPLVGLLIGAGNFASKLLLSLGSDSFWMNMAALLIAVVPFFFLPTLLKNSFTAMGNIGSRISGIGKRVGSGLGGTARKGLQNSNLHQSNLEGVKRSGAEHRNGITSKRMDRAVQNGNYKDKNGKKANSYNDLSQEEKERFNKEHRGLSRRFANDNALIAGDDETLNKRSTQMDEGYLSASAAQSRVSAANATDEMNEKNDKTISSMDVGEYDEEGNAVLDEKGNQKTEKAFYDKKSNSWKIDTGKEDANGNAIYKAVNQKQMEEIRKAQFGKNPERVRIGKDGEKEFMLNKNSGKYEDADGNEATEDEMKEINDNLAKGQMLHNYTKKFGQNDFVDSLGNKLDGGERLAAAGFSQSWADLQRTKFAEERGKARGDLIGGYAGQNAATLANASQLSSENEAMSRTNIALGQADALHDLRGQGYNTATSRISASQAAGQKILGTMEGNVSAMEIERTAGVQSLMTAALTVDEKAKIVTAAKAGKLEALMGDDSTSDSMKRVIRSMLESKKDYTSFGSLRPGSAEIKQDIEGFQTELMNASGAISASEKAELITASKNGVPALQKIVDSSTATSQQKAIARAMLASGTDYSSFGNSPQGSSKIREDINSIESFMTNVDSSLTTAQKEKLVTAAKNGTLEANYLNNSSASAVEKYVAQKILDVKASDSKIDYSQNGYGSQFIKSIIDNNSGFEKVAGFTKTVQPSAEGVLSIGRTVNQVSNAVNAGSTKLVSQFETQIAGEKAGEVKVDRAVAEHQAQQAKTIKQAEQDAYADILSGSVEGMSADDITVKTNKVYNQAQRKIMVNAAQNLLDTSPPNWTTIKGDAEVRRFNEEIKAKEAEITRTKENGRSLVDSIPALQARLEEAARVNDEAEIRAIVNILSKKGENGQEAVHQALANLNREGAVRGQYYIASHLVNNYGGEYKNTSRSTFDYSQQILSNPNVPIEWDSTISTNVGSLKSATFATANDAEVDRYIKALSEGLLTREQAEQLNDVVTNALDTDTIKGSMKQGQIARFKQIQHLYKSPETKYAETPQQTPDEEAGAGKGPGGTSISSTPGNGYGDAVDVK